MPTKYRHATRRPVARKKAPRRNTAKQVLFLKRRVKRAVLEFYVISVVFLGMLALSSAFLLYQWKDYQLVEFAKEIQLLQSDILRLQSAVNRHQTTINTELLKYHRIVQVAQEKLALKPSVEEPVVLSVDKNQLDDYVQKDRQEAEEK